MPGTLERRVRKKAAKSAVPRSMDGVEIEGEGWGSGSIEVVKLLPNWMLVIEFGEGINQQGGDIVKVLLRMRRSVSPFPLILSHPFHSHEDCTFQFPIRSKRSHSSSELEDPRQPVIVRLPRFFSTKSALWQKIKVSRCLPRGVGVQGQVQVLPPGRDQRALEDRWSITHHWVCILTSKASCFSTPAIVASSVAKMWSLSLSFINRIDSILCLMACKGMVSPRIWARCADMYASVACKLAAQLRSTAIQMEAMRSLSRYSVLYSFSPEAPSTG